MTFRFPEPVRLSRIVLSGAHERRKELLNTPGALTLRADGREVYRNDRLDAAFRRLRAELDFKPAEAKEWVLEFPWRESGRRELRRVEPALTEIELYGAETPIPAGARSVDLTLRLLAPGSAPVIIASLPGVTAAPGGQLRREFAVRLPELPAHGIAPCRIEAVDGSGTVVAALPLLVIDPGRAAAERPRSPPGPRHLPGAGDRDPRRALLLRARHRFARHPGELGRTRRQSLLLCEPAQAGQPQRLDRARKAVSHRKRLQPLRESVGMFSERTTLLRGGRAEPSSR